MTDGVVIGKASPNIHQLNWLFLAKLAFVQEAGLKNSFIHKTRLYEERNPRTLGWSSGGSSFKIEDKPLYDKFEHVSTLKLIFFLR